MITQKTTSMNSLNDAWRSTLKKILDEGSACAPRDQLIMELLNHNIVVDMEFPVLTNPARKLNYRFMAAEAAWILSGSDRLADIAPYNKRMAEFSDDSVTLAGAYGPRFVQQVMHVVDTLRADRDTRRATMTLWQPNPKPSKDIPCTVALDFKIRGDYLHTQVFMRSSDAWLGLPYDVFTFTMMSCTIIDWLAHVDIDVLPGNLYLTMASSHLYDKDIPRARACLDVDDTDAWALPMRFYHSATTGFKGPRPNLEALRDNIETMKWWTR